MVKITVQIEGMACAMCESHVNDAIRREFDVVSVCSSHSDKNTEILAKDPINEEKIAEVVESIGFKVLSVKTENA